MKDFFLRIKTIYWVIIIISFDIVLSLLWVQLNQPSQHESMVGLAIITYLFVLNVTVALIALILKNFKLCIVLFLNSILSPIIFLYVFSSWNDYDRHTNYKHYIIHKDSNAYQLYIDKHEQYFELSNITNMPAGTSVGIKSNYYTIQNDTLHFIDSTLNMFTVDNILYGFPSQNDKITMTEVNSTFDR